MDKDTKNYIDEMYKDGFSDEQIKEKFMGAGWSEEQIDQVLSEQKASRSASEPQAAEEKQNSKGKNIYIYIIVGIVALIAIAFSFVLYTGAWNPFYDSELDLAAEESERERDEVVANREARALMRIENPHEVELPPITEVEAQAVRNSFEDETSALISFYNHSKILLEVDINNPGAGVFCENWVEGLGELAPEFSENPENLFMMAVAIPHRDTANEIIADIVAKRDFVSACAALDIEDMAEYLREIGSTHVIAGRMLQQAGVDVSIE